MKFQFKEGSFTAQFGGSELTIAKDNDIGFRPFQLMISSLAGCSGFVFSQILEKQRIHLDDFYITAEIERNVAKANRIEKVDLIFHVKGDNLNEEKLERNLQLTRKNCGMIQSVAEQIEVTERLNIL